MAVRRIVANISAEDLAPAQAFYGELLGLDIVMDLGWIVTFAAPGQAVPQVSIALEGGNGAPVPDLSIEVAGEELEALHRRALTAGYAVEYGPVTEPWGVRRFFLRDPFGRLVNILTHV
uniref:VOC family protein n=1 Tax=Siccirubricoccus phaeus TaxID=2595053 RepID=UPI0011F24EC6